MKRSKNRLVARPEGIPDQPYASDAQYPQIRVPAFIGGLNTQDDPTDIPGEALVEAENVFIRNTRLTRRAGESVIGPAKPSSTPVRALFSIKEFNGALLQLQAKDNTLYRRTPTTWQFITPNTLTPFTKAINDLISVDDRHFFSSQGTTGIKEYLPLLDEYVDLGNAPRYRFITAFGDRIVGLYLGFSNPVMVGWSGNRNYNEWDPLIDPSAGSVPLVESQSDYADFGTGVFGFGDKLLILKERSIWLAALTGSSTNPFYFYVTSPFFGCDTPTSIQKLPGGVVYYDRRTNNVYLFDVNNPTPVPIANDIQDYILSLVDRPEDIFSSFDPIELEYRLGVRYQGSSETIIFVHSFKVGKWWIEKRVNVTSINSLDFSDPTMIIQDLPGNIEDLPGTIASLSDSGYPIPITFFGKEDGEVEITDESIVSGYDTRIRSKTWTATDNNDFFISRLTFTYEIINTGSFIISYSKDSGLTYTAYKTVTMDVVDIGKRIIVNCVKTIRARQFNWLITSSTGRFSIVDFKALTSPAGYSSK